MIVVRVIPNTSFMDCCFFFRLWDEFYTEEDIQTFAANGISHLRIPVGYWIWDVSDDEPFPPPPANDDEAQRFYLKRLLKWAENAGLKVLILLIYDNA